MPQTLVEKHESIAHHRGGAKAWFFWCVASLFYVYEFFLRDAGSMIESDLQKTFDASAQEIGGVMSIYLWFYAPMQIVAGILLDKFGTRKTLPWAAILCVLGAVLFALSQNLWMLAISRAMLGLGSAFAFIGAIYLASVWFPPSRLALLAGLTIALGVVGGMIAQSPMAWLNDVVGWRSTVLITAGAGLLLSGLMLWTIPPRPQWFVELFCEEEKSITEFFKGLGQVMSNRQSLLVGIMAGMVWLPVSVFAALWGVRYLTGTLEISIAEAGIGVIIMYFGLLLGGPFWGFLSDRLHRRKLPIMVGIGLSCVVMLVIVLFNPGLTIYGVYSLLFVVGFMTSSQGVTFAMAAEIHSPKLGGIAIGVNNFLIMIIGAALMWGLGILLDYKAGPQLAEHAEKIPPQDFKFMMMAIPICLVIGFVLTFFMRDTHRLRLTDEESDSMPPVGHG